MGMQDGMQGEGWDAMGGGMALVRVISSVVDLLVGMTAGELPSVIYAQGGQPTVRSTWSME